MWDPPLIPCWPPANSLTNTREPMTPSAGPPTYWRWPALDTPAMRYCYKPFVTG